MKPYLFTLLALVLLSGCMRKVQLVTLSGSNTKTDLTGLVLDNDTLTLRYSFSSERGRMVVSLVNKLNRPLYVDWKRSAFIIGQDQFAYWQDVSDVSLSNWNSQYGRYSIGSAVGTISKADQIGFVSPGTRLDKQRFVLVPRDQSGLLMSGPFTVVKEIPRWDSSRKEPIDVNVYTYSAEQSPLQFRNYLTLSTDKDFSSEFTIDTKFWASDVRILPKEQISGVMGVKQPDGTYTAVDVTTKPTEFYILLPMQ